MQAPVSPPERATRTKCPFYGFCYMGGAFLDTNGNQCPFKTDSFSPCYMWANGLDPDWDSCGYNDGNSLDVFKDKPIFPNEFHPKDAKSWGGIKFGEWADYILNGQQIRSPESKPSGLLARLSNLLKGS